MRISDFSPFALASQLGGHTIRAALAAPVLAALAASCAAGGQYSYSHSYEPLSDENALIERAADLSYEEVRRTRLNEQQLVGWFGIVTEPPQIAADGTTRLHLSLRAHQDRHLCATSASDSCRVTVSQRSLGEFVADVTVRPEHRDGQMRIWTGSLVRVYGTAVEQDPDLGPVLRVEWYRHWPPHYFVTTGAASSMRR